MIAFNNITIRVHKQPLLTDVDLHVQGGEKVVIRGPSGCGKSSLLKCAVGALPLTGGSVQFSGLTLSEKTVREVRSRIAFIGQEPVLGAENVRDALLLPFSYKAHRHTRPGDAHIFQTLENLKLNASILDQSTNRISGGEKQRIAIARALLLNKTVFFADEITSALDPESKQAVMDELFRPGITLLSVSHDPDWIQACNRIVEINEQQLIEVHP
ncbi:ABC transporter ATP-binding protein [Pontiellaceae bacterium B12219]|nr:ABC transporter ATP-binding protein [Pontiellaceae bacterium B12219]